MIVANEKAAIKPSINYSRAFFANGNIMLKMYWFSVLRHIFMIDEGSI